jgi:threonine dehydratase
MITKDDILSARERIRPHVLQTPLLRASRLGAAAGVELYHKCESFQRTGSFKSRGALNAILQLGDAERRRGVVTMSAGNHAQAVAWAAAMAGTEAVTVMPESAPQTKVTATRGYGAQVELVGGERMKVFERARAIEQQGRIMIHPFEDPRVAAGAGTVAVEILEQLPDVDVVVVPIGGGGLIAGIAVALQALRPGTRVIGVEPDGAPTMRKSLDAGAPQQISPKTIADGLMAPIVGAGTLEAVRRYVEDVVLVSDDMIMEALRALGAGAKLVAEPAGAAATAAVLSGALRLPTGARVVCVVSGGNVDLDRLAGFYAG